MNETKSASSSFRSHPPDMGQLRIEELELQITSLRRQLDDSKHNVAHIKQINDALVLEIRDRNRNIERLFTVLPRTQVDAAKAHNWDVHQRERQMQLLAGVEIDENGELETTCTRGESAGYRDCPVSGLAEIEEYTVLNRLASDSRNLELV